MYKAKETKKFKKDYTLLELQHKNLEPLDSLVIELQDRNFTHAYKLHKLEPKSKNIWECHVGSITSDWVLVFTYEEKQLILLLLRTGSHSKILEVKGEE